MGENNNESVRGGEGKRGGERDGESNKGKGREKNIIVRRKKRESFREELGKVKWNKGVEKV